MIQPIDWNNFIEFEWLWRLWLLLFHSHRLIQNHYFTSRLSHTQFISKLWAQEPIQKSYKSIIYYQWIQKRLVWKAKYLFIWTEKEIDVRFALSLNRGKDWNYFLWLKMGCIQMSTSYQNKLSGHLEQIHSSNVGSIDRFASRSQFLKSPAWSNRK